MDEIKTYHAVVLGNTLAVSRDKKTPSVKIKLQTLYETSDITKPVIMTVYGDLWLSYAATARSYKTLKEVFDWQGHYIEDLKEPILAGKKVDIVCSVGEWEGKPQLNVNFFNKPGGMRTVNDEELAHIIAEVQPVLNEVIGVDPVSVDQNVIQTNSFSDDAPINSKYGDDCSF